VKKALRKPCVSTSHPPSASPAPSPLTMKVVDQVKASVA